MEINNKQLKRLEKIALFIDDKDVSTLQNILELDDKVTSLNEKIDTVTSSINSNIQSISENLKKKLESELVLEINKEELKGDKGDRGDKGDKGDKGEQGKDGLNGFDGKDGKDGRDGVDGINGINGKDGSPDTPKEIKIKLESLKDEERLDASAIKNLPKSVERIIETRGENWGGFIETPIKAGTGINVSKNEAGAYVINNTSPYTADLSNITLTYTGNQLTSKSYASGKTITYAYTGNKLTSKTDGTNTWTYGYTGNQLTSIIIT